MEVEQVRPNKPNFFLVVILFCATLVIIFVLALFFVHFDGKHLTFRHHSAHPTSRLVLPAPLNAAPDTLA
jgi:RsiW-degrading membrane proteinase PrsW (M82 family)